MTGYSLVFSELPIGRSVIEMDVGPGASGNLDEEDLLTRALEQASRLGADHSHICIMPGSAKQGLLESRGFSHVQTYFDMVWNHNTLPEATRPKEYRVRSFQAGDAALLTKVQNDAFTGSWGFCPSTVDQIEYRSQMPNTSEAGILFLFDGDTPAGYCWITMSPAHGKIRGMIGVVPEYRGKGVNRCILHAGMAYLRSAGVSDIGLEVDGSNAPAVGLYTSTGFEKTGEHYWFELGLPCMLKPER